MVEKRTADWSHIATVVSQAFASAALGAEAAAAANTPTQGIVVAGLAGALSPLGNAMLDELAHWYRARKSKRLVEFFAVCAAADDGAAPEAVDARIRALVESQSAREALIEALRGLDEALSDDVIPALARLLALYRTSNRPADAFFRGLRRVLQALNADSFAELVAALRTFRDASPSAVQEIRAGVAPFNTPNMPELIGLLNANRLSHDPTAGGLASTTGPFIPSAGAIIESRRAQQMLVILDSREELRWVEPG